MILALRHQPAALILSRQALPTLDRSKYAPAAGLGKGAYVLADAPGGHPELVIIAAGGGVSLAVSAARAVGERRGFAAASCRHAVLGGSSMVSRSNIATRCCRRS